jgi:Cdc6-like AAA superfamily ATPase
MKIDYENLEKLTVIIEELGAGLRDNVFDVVYTPKELEQTHELVRRMNAALKWTLNYFDYYETYKESNPVIMLVEMDNLRKQGGLDFGEQQELIDSIFQMHVDKEIEP